MVGASDILTGLQGLWSGNSTLAALIPGGMHVDPPGPGVAAPYVLVKIVDGEPDINSSLNYIQKFEVQLTVWSEKGAADGGKIRTALDATFAQDRYAQLLLPGRGNRCMAMVQGAGKLEIDPAMHNGNYVLQTGIKRSIMVQATR